MDKKGSIVKATDGFSLHGWMVTELHLEGGELLAFALVHQFSQAFVGEYTGNTSYFASWTGWTENTCRKYLSSLAQKGLIVEKRGRENNTPFCHYTLAPDFYEKHPSIFEESPRKKQQMHPSKFEESTPQNLRGNNNSINNNSQSIIPPTPQEVTKYASERGFRDPAGFAATFVAYYEAAHWCKKDGTKIRNWRQAVITWEANNKNRVFPKDSNSENKQIGWEQYEKIMQN